jgi:hypothetical protein
MNMMGFPNKLVVKLARLTTEEQEISIHIHNQTSTSFSSNTGLKQGDALVPVLFNIALEMTLQQAQCNLNGTIFNKSHIVLAYADDIVILSQSTYDRDF